MFQPEIVRAFYNAYAGREWDRLEATPEGRITHFLHQRFVDGCFRPGISVLDAGCGPGRFSIEMAAAGSEVTLFDLSDEQLASARDKMKQHGLADRVKDYVQGDVRNLSALPDGTYDTVVCYGAVLNYLFEDALLALRELVRVTRPGGQLVLSVNSRWGALRYFIANEGQDPACFLGRPEYWHIDLVATTGHLPQHPEVAHPPRYFYDSAELRGLLLTVGIREIEMAAAPVLATGLRARLREIEACPEAWATVLSLEEQAYRRAGLVDSGYHILARGRVPTLGEQHRRV